MGKHTFGGRSLDRYILDFEATETGGDDSGAADDGGFDSYEAVVEAADAVDGAEAGADPSTAPEAGAEATDTGAEAPSPAEAAAPAWVPNQDEYEEMRQQHQVVLELLARGATQGTEGAAEQLEAAPEIPDVLDPDYAEKMSSYLNWRDEQRDQQWAEKVKPLEEIAREREQEQGRAIKESLIDKLNVEGFDKTKPEHREGAEFFAVGLIDQVKAEMGVPVDQPNAHAAEVALQRGAEKYAAFAKAERDAGKAAYIEELENLRKGGEGHVPGVSGGGIEGVVDTDDYDEALARITG